MTQKKSSAKRVPSVPEATVAGEYLVVREQPQITVGQLSTRERRVLSTDYGRWIDTRYTAAASLVAFGGIIAGGITGLPASCITAPASLALLYRGTIGTYVGRTRQANTYAEVKERDGSWHFPNRNIPVEDTRQNIDQAPLFHGNFPLKSLVDSTRGFPGISVGASETPQGLRVEGTINPASVVACLLQEEDRISDRMNQARPSLRDLHLGAAALPAAHTGRAAEFQTAYDAHEARALYGALGAAGTMLMDVRVQLSTDIKNFAARSTFDNAGAEHPGLADLSARLTDMAEPFTLPALVEYRQSLPGQGV